MSGTKRISNDYISDDVVTWSDDVAIWPFISITRHTGWLPTYIVCMWSCMAEQSLHCSIMSECDALLLMSATRQSMRRILLIAIAICIEMLRTSCRQSHFCYSQCIAHRVWEPSIRISSITAIG